MRSPSSISQIPVAAIIGAGICLLPMLWSKSTGMNTHSFFSTLSLTVPVLTILFIWIQSFLFPRKTAKCPGFENCAVALNGLKKTSECRSFCTRKIKH